MENEVILSKILEIGEGMLISGGEVNRVEDSITRLCTAYHMRNINVFTITASIVVWHKVLWTKHYISPVL